MYKKNTYLFVTLLCVILGIIILKLFNDQNFVRGFLGDLIAVIFIYCLIKIFFNIKPIRLGIYVIFISFFIELMQFFKVVNILGIGNNRAAKLILGSVFDPYDLIAYLAGIVLIVFFDCYKSHCLSLIYKGNTKI